MQNKASAALMVASELALIEIEVVILIKNLEEMDKEFMAVENLGSVGADMAVALEKVVVWAAIMMGLNG